MAWMVPDELWALVAPLLPPPPSHARGGRPRIPDRKAFAGILFILRSGCPWSLLPPSSAAAAGAPAGAGCATGRRRACGDDSNGCCSSA